MQKRNLYTPFIGAILILVLAFAAYKLWKPVVVTTSPNTATTTTDTLSLKTATASTSGSVVTASGKGNYEITTLPVKAVSAVKAPDYKKSLTFAASIAADVRTALQKQWTITVAAITKDSLDFNAWINLGNIRHIAGDDVGAKQVWEYVSANWPSNTVSFGSLGDLYMNFLKDYPKAEANFLIAIKNNPRDPNSYKNLFELYYNHGFARTATAAEDILKKGIAAIPRAIDMQVILARYYRDTGRAADAKATYDAAIVSAKAQGLLDLAAQIQVEANSVR